MAIYEFDPMVAVDPSLPGSVIVNGSGHVYATTDTNFTTPLVTKALDGSTLSAITTNARGLALAFTVEDHPVVVFKDDGPGGTALLYSIRGTIEEVMARTALAEQYAADAAASAANIAAFQDSGLHEVLDDPATSSGKLIRRLAHVPNPYVEGVPLYNIGHSYTMYPYPYATKFGGEYYRRVAKRLHMGPVYPLGRSATYAIDNFGRMLSDKYDGGIAKWTPGSKGVGIIQNAMNELGSGAAADTKFRNNWRMGILGEIALMSSAETKDYDQRSAVSGTWSWHNTTEAEKGLNSKNYFSSTAGAYVEWTFSGPEVFLVAPISDTYALSTFTVSVDGVDKLGTVNPMGQKHPTSTDSVSGTVHAYTSGIWRITGLSAGAHTLRFTRNGTGNAFVGGIIVPATNPPVVYLVKEPPRAGTGAPTYTANIAWYNGELDTLAASFPNVYTVDFAPEWDNSVMIGSLDTGASFHPNDIGHSKMADHMVNAINSTITTWRNGVVIL